MNSKDILAAMEKISHLIPPRAPDPLDFLAFKPRTFMGMNVIERPPPPPKIQVRRLVLSDGTCITPPEFLARENAAWLDMFGYRDDPWKDKILMLSNWGMSVSRDHMALLRNIGA
jgi:hypothetical protein